MFFSLAPDDFRTLVFSGESLERGSGVKFTTTFPAFSCSVSWLAAPIEEIS